MKYLVWALPLLMLTGCASNALLPNGMYAHQFKIERPSLFGTNTASTRNAQCPKNLLEFQSTETPDYKAAAADCQWIQSEWHDSASQGQGGQIAAGALNGIGIGIAGALIGNGGANASATATATQSMTTNKSH